MTCRLYTKTCKNLHSSTCIQLYHIQTTYRHANNMWYMHATFITYKQHADMQTTCGTCIQHLSHTNNMQTCKQQAGHADRRTLTHNSDIFAMETVVHTKSIVGAVHKSRFVSGTPHIVEQYRTCSGPKSLHSDGPREAKLAADDLGIVHGPAIIAHSTPLSSEQHLDSPLITVVTAHQPNWRDFLLICRIGEQRESVLSCMYCVYCVHCVYSMYCVHCVHCVYCVYCMYYVYCTHTHLHRSPQCLQCGDNYGCRSHHNHIRRVEFRSHDTSHHPTR